MKPITKRVVIQRLRRLSKTLLGLGMGLIVASGTVVAQDRVGWIGAQSGHSEARPLSKDGQRYVDFMKENPFDTYRLPMTVYSDYGLFKYSELFNLNRFFTISEHVGYSGAGYADIGEFKEQFKGHLFEQLRATPEHGAAVVVLGGTVDGIGAAYDVVREFTDTREYQTLKSPLYRRIEVLGMVSGHAVAFHIEGAKEGWGDVVSPKQDGLFLMPTEEGEWELRPDRDRYSHTTDIIEEARRMPNCVEASFVVYEGGEQALRETLELLLRANSAGKEAAPLEVILETGHEPGKPSKDRGPRAARQVALAISQGVLPLSNAMLVLVHTVGGAEYLTPQKFLKDTAVGRALVKDVQFGQMLTHVEKSPAALSNEEGVRALTDSKAEDAKTRVEAREKYIAAVGKTLDTVAKVLRQQVRIREADILRSERGQTFATGRWGTHQAHIVDKKRAHEEVRRAHRKIHGVIRGQEKAAKARAMRIRGR